MFDPVLMLAFVPAALALNLLPGADMMFCLAQGLKGGRRPALAASAGVSTGAMVHVTLAGLGLGAVVQTFPWAFGAIRWLGAAYLLWLAWRTLRSPITLNADEATPQTRRAFRDGLLVNLSNPKVILFILAFVPQFIDPARPVLAQFLIYGAVLSTGGFVVNGLVGIGAGTIRHQMSRRPWVERVLRLGSASIFTALAARIGWEATRA